MPLSIELKLGDQVDINHGDVMVEVKRLTGRRVRLTFHAQRHIAISRRGMEHELRGGDPDNHTSGCT